MKVYGLQNGIREELDIDERLCREALDELMRLLEKQRDRPEYSPNLLKIAKTAVLGQPSAVDLVRSNLRAFLRAACFDFLTSDSDQGGHGNETLTQRYCRYRPRAGQLQLHLAGVHYTLPAPCSNDTGRSDSRDRVASSHDTVQENKSSLQPVDCVLIVLVTLISLSVVIGIVIFSSRGGSANRNQPRKVSSAQTNAAAVRIDEKKEQPKLTQLPQRAQFESSYRSNRVRLKPPRTPEALVEQAVSGLDNQLKDLAAQRSALLAKGLSNSAATLEIEMFRVAERIEGLKFYSPKSK